MGVFDLKISNFWILTDEDLIFNMEEINQIPENSVPPTNISLLNPQSSKHRQRSPQRKRNGPQRHVSFLLLTLPPQTLNFLFPRFLIKKDTESTSHHYPTCQGVKSSVI